MSRHDALIVGAGVAGLATGCLLAAAGLRVAVLEHHHTPGGLLQRFRRAGIPFDTGFHYMGGAGEGGPLRKYLEQLGVLGRIDLLPFDPDGFDEVVLPGRRVPLPLGAARAADRLAAEFPDDAAGVRVYLARVEEAARMHPSAAADGAGPRALRGGAGRVTEVLAAHVRDPDLQAVLCAHAFLYGGPASTTAFESHAVVVASYLHSAHGVRGGGSSIAAALVAELASRGGELRLRTGVRRILAAGGAVTGIETDGGEVLEAPVVVSTAHPAATLSLLADAPVPQRHARRVRELRDTPSGILVHAVARGVRPAPFRRNRFWFARPEAAWAAVSPWYVAGAEPPCAAILPGPETPEVADSTVFQVLCPLAPEDGASADDEAAHAARKRLAAGRAVPIAEFCVPEWAGRIEVVDVSTPRAVRRYVRSPSGSCFGAGPASGDWLAPKFATGFGISGLHSAGQSVWLPGLYGSVASAFLAARAVLGAGR